MDIYDFQIIIRTVCLALHLSSRGKCNHPRDPLRVARPRGPFYHPAVPPRCAPSAPVPFSQVAATYVPEVPQQPVARLLSARPCAAAGPRVPAASPRGLAATFQAQPYRVLSVSRLRSGMKSFSSRRSGLFWVTAIAENRAAPRTVHVVPSPNNSRLDPCEAHPRKRGLLASTHTK